MTVAPGLHQPALPQNVRQATSRLLDAALRCRIAADLGEARIARQAATEVLALLDGGPMNSAHQRAVKHHQPELWADNG